MDSLRSSLWEFALLFEDVLNMGDSSERLKPLFDKKSDLRSQMLTLGAEVSKMTTAGHEYLRKEGIPEIHDATHGLVIGGDDYFRAMFPPLMRRYGPTFVPVAVATAATLLDDLGLDPFAHRLSEVAANTVVYDDFDTLLRKPQLDHDDEVNFNTWWHKLQLADVYCEGIIPDIFGVAKSIIVHISRRLHFYFLTWSAS